MSATNALSARLIGAIFLERGLVTEEELQAALEQQAETKEHLGEILVQQYGVSRIELAGVLAEQWAAVEQENSRSDPAPALTALPSSPSPTTDDGPESSDGEHQSPDTEEERRPLGEIFVEQGFVTDEELDQALETQRNGGEKLGEILVSQGSITRLQLASALADQWTSLKKIRPPSSPEQPPAPALAVVPPPGAPPAEQSTGAPPADVVQLRDAVTALEQRLRVAESVAAREPWREEIGSATALLRHAVADIEERLAELATREELAPVEQLRTEFDELAGRVDSLATSERVHEAELTRKVDSAAESAEAARSGLGGAFESMSLRLADVEARVHDRSDITELHKELEVLVGRVAELAELSNELQSSETEGLREEMQRVLDEVTRRGPASPGDPELAERIDALAAHIDEIVDALRGIQTATGSTQEANALGEALAALAARVQALEGGSEIEELRRSIAELEARPDVDSVLTERLSQHGIAPDALKNLRERLDDVERQSSASSQGNPELEGQIAGLATRLQALEAGTNAEELVELRRTVEELAQRPAGDPALAARVEQLGRELEQSSSAGPELEALRDRVGAVAAEIRGLDSVAADVEALRSRLGGLDEIASRLEAVESDGARVDDLRRQLEHLSTRPTADPELVEQLSRRFERVSATASQLEELRSRLDELAARTGAPAEGVAELRGELDGLEQRLDSLADTSADTARQDEVAALAARLHALESSTSGPELEELRGEVEKLAAETRSLDSVVVDVEALRSRLGGLDEIASRLEAVESDGARVDDLHRQLEHLSTRPTADPELLEQLSRRFERVSATASQLEELRGRLDELAAQVGAPAEGVAELRGELAGLEQRLESLAERNVDAVYQDDVAALAARLQALESSSGGDELVALRRRVEEIALRPVGDPALAGRVEQLARELEESSATGAQLDELRGRVEDLARSHEEDRAGTDSRLETITGELRRALGQLGTRLDTVEVTASEERPDEYGPRIELLESRLNDGASRELALDRRIDVVTAQLAVLDELQAHLDDLGARFVAQQDAQEKRVRKSDLSGLRTDLSGQLETLEQRLEEFARDAGKTREASEKRLEELVSALQQEVGGQREELGDRVAAAERGAAALRAELSRLHSAADVNEAWRSSAESELERRIEELGERLSVDISSAQGELAPALDDVRAGLSSLSTRLDRSDATTSRALDELKTDLEAVVRSSGELLEHIEQAGGAGGFGALGERVEGLERRLEAGAALSEEQVRATEEALRAGLSSLGERLAETESTYIEAGGALRRSIERLGAAIVEADGLVTERVHSDPVVEQEIDGPFLAFVPNGKGYGLEEINGRPPAVGEPLSMSGSEDEFVVTRIGRSPLPLDRRRCVYLERQERSQASF